MKIRARLPLEGLRSSLSNPKCCKPNEYGLRLYYLARRYRIVIFPCHKNLEGRSIQNLYPSRICKIPIPKYQKVEPGLIICRDSVFLDFKVTIHGFIYF